MTDIPKWVRDAGEGIFRAFPEGFVPSYELTFAIARALVKAKAVERCRCEETALKLKRGSSDWDLACDTIATAIRMRDKS